MMITDSQCAKDQEGSEVGADDHVEVVLLEHVGQVADDQEDDARDEHDHDVADQRAAQRDAHFNAIVDSKLDFAHHVTFHRVLCQVLWTCVGKIFWDQGCKVLVFLGNHVFLGALLGVKWVPFHIEFARPNSRIFLPQVMFVRRLGAASECTPAHSAAAQCLEAVIFQEETCFR